MSTWGWAIAVAAAACSACGAAGGTEAPTVTAAAAGDGHVRRATETERRSPDANGTEGGDGEDGPARAADGTAGADEDAHAETQAGADPEPGVARASMPAPPAPGVDGASIEALAPWSFDAQLAPRSRVIAPAPGGPLVAFDDTRFVAIHGDGTTPILVRDNPIGHTPVFADFLLPAAPVAQGAFLVRGAEDQVAAVDLATLDVRWTARLGVTVGGSYEAHLSSGDAFLVVARHDLIALDPASGAVLWRTSFPPARVFSRGQGWRAADGLFLLFDGGLVARDARTGEVRWRVDGFDSRSDRFFDPSGGLVPILHDGELAIISVADGTERARVALPSSPPNGRTVVLVGDELYVALPTRSGELEVRRYDLSASTTAPRWRSPSFTTDDNGFHPSIAVDDDAVFLCTRSRYARALDRTAGRERWSERTTSCSNPLLWRPREGAPNVLLGSSWASAGFARAAVERASRTVTVSGVVRCEGRPAARARIWIGGTRVRADAAGHYRGTTRATDAVEVMVEQHGIDEFSFCSYQQRELPVTGGRLRADFDLEHGGGDGGL